MTARSLPCLVRTSRTPLALLLLAALAACDGGESTSTPAPRVTVDLAAVPYRTLAEYGFFVGRLADESPAPGVIPYTVAAPLWADHAGKGRFVVLPEGAAITVAGPDDWQLPVGSVVIKSFSYSKDLRDPEGTRQLIETRLLIHEADGWTGHTYLWDEAQTEAIRHVPGRNLTLSYADEAGAATTRPYIVPNTNQCKSCHEVDDALRVLGLASRQILGESRERFLAEGVLAAEPPATPALVDPFGDAPLAERARSYLDANCSHCHRPGGGGGPSGLVLLASETHPSTYGICKSPVAAGPGAGGRTADIVPGHPDQSILIYRMSSTDPEIKMPEIPNLLVDEQGVALISAWIEGMDPPGCNGEP